MTAFGGVVHVEALNLSWLISVDDHVLEPGDLWLRRLPSKYHEVAPRIVVEDGAELWAYEDVRTRTSGLSATAGTDKLTWTMRGVEYGQMRPGCYDPAARV